MRLTAAGPGQRIKLEHFHKFGTKPTPPVANLRCPDAAPLHQLLLGQFVAYKSALPPPAQLNLYRPLKRWSERRVLQV